MKEYAVYIGRFQPFHNAHLETVRLALTRAKKLIVVIGSATIARSVKNPWSAAERIAMITSCLTPDEQERVSFVTAKDYLYNDNLWIAALQQSVLDATCGSTDVILIGHKKDESSFYLKLFPQWGFQESAVGVRSSLDATTIRESLFSEDVEAIKSSVPEHVYEMLMSYMKTDEYNRLYEEWHHIKSYKALWKSAPFPPTFNTVDAVVVCSGHVLLVRRKAAPGKGLLALPGGFINQNEGLEDACLRELKEETCIAVSRDELRKHIESEKTFGHPARSLRGRTITHAFCINLGAGSLPRVKGSDDAEKAFWMSFSDIFAKEDQFFDDHFHIVNFFVTRF